MNVFRGGPSIVPEAFRSETNGTSQAKRSAGRPATHRTRGVGGVGRRASARAPHRLTATPTTANASDQTTVVIARPVREDSRQATASGSGARGSSRH